MGHERYGDFDPGRMLVWLANVIRNPDMLTIRTEHAGLIAEYTTRVWYPKQPECHVVFLCAASGYHWQAASLLRRSVAWARSRGCVRWHFNSDTTHRIDVLAKWVGAREHSPRFVLDL